MENKFILYMHISPSNKRYIGITSQSPKERWQNGRGYNRNKHFTNAINKYGWNNFKHIIIFEELTKEEAELMERFYIALYDTMNDDKGYNKTEGGSGTIGYQWTDEDRKKRSEIYNGEGNPFYGKKHTQETIDKIKINKKGKKLTEETKRKISENHRDVSGKNNPMYDVCRKGGNNPNAKKVIRLDTYEVFDTITEASESVDGNIQSLSKALNKNKPYKGIKFMYYNEYLDNGEKDIKYKEVKRKYGKDNTSSKKVICLDNGMIFNSIREASDYIGCNQASLRVSINKHRKYNGYSFMRYNEYLENGIVEIRDKIK